MNEENLNNQGMSSNQDNDNQPSSSIKPTLSSFSVLFDKSTAIYKASFNKFISMTLLPIAGFAVLALIFVLYAYIRTSLSVMHSNSLIGIINLPVILLSIAAFTFLIALFIISKSGIYILIRDSEKDLTFKQAFTEAKSHAMKIFTIQLISIVYILLWTLLFIIPGVIMGIYYSMSIWVYIYEGLTGGKALKRSKELVKGYWLWIFSRYAILYVLFYLISFIIDQIGKFGHIESVSNIIGFLFSILFGPLAVIYSCFLYWDLRASKSEKI